MHPSYPAIYQPPADWTSYLTFLNPLNLVQQYIAWGSLLTLITILIHVIFAIGILMNASRMRSTGGRTFVAPGWIWALATLLGGVIPVLAYWLIHHSSLRAITPPWVAAREKASERK